MAPRWLNCYFCKSFGAIIGIIIIVPKPEVLLKERRCFLNSQAELRR